MLKSTIICLIKKLFPYNINTITKCGEGVDAVAFKINEDTIVKVPKSIHSSIKLKYETEILCHLENLSLQMKTPKFVCLVETKITKPPFFSIISKMDGVALDRKTFDCFSEKSRDKLAEQIAEFLFRIHNSKVDNLDIPTIDMLTKYQKDYNIIISHFANLLDSKVLYELENMYNKLRMLYTEYPAHNGLVHGDFSLDTLFYNLKEDKLEGIIDFGDGKITDTETDFIYLLEDLEDYPKDFGKKVYDYYGGKDIDIIEKKIIIDHSYWEIERLMRAYERDEDASIEKILKKITKNSTFINNIRLI